MTDIKLKLVIVDDHAVVRAGYRLLLEAESDFEVIAELSSGEEANQQLAGLNPDVAIMDISMPGMGGLEAIKRIKIKLPDLKFLVFTMHDNQTFMEHALEAGAHGYVTKNSAPNVLVEAVRKVCSGGQYIDAELEEKLMLSRSQGKGGVLGRLSKREFQIFCKFAEGLNTQEISDELSLSIKTVANYQTQIKEKLGISSTSELVKLAINKGIIQL